MNRSRLAPALGLAVLSLGCTRDECHDPRPELDEVGLQRWIARNLTLPERLIELKAGTGRLAQPDRRMFLTLTIELADGGTLGAGEVMVEYPLYRNDVAQIHTQEVASNTKLFAAIAGMREGGEREFSWRSTLQRPDECHPRGRKCEMTVGKTQVAYPPDTELTVRATLERLCAPSYCVENGFSIPKSEWHRLRERSCR